MTDVTNFYNSIDNDNASKAILRFPVTGVDYVMWRDMAGDEEIGFCVVMFDHGKPYNTERMTLERDGVSFAQYIKDVVSECVELGNKVSIKIE